MTPAMVSRASRRGFLGRMGAAGLSLMAPGCVSLRGRGKSAPAYLWSGIGFGIDMSMEIHGVDDREGARFANSCRRVIHEMEQAFSLYLEDSELRRLNRDRRLAEPSPLFHELLAVARDLESRTLGYYQPAIHGAWEWLEQQGFEVPAGRRADWQRHGEAATMRHVESAADGSIRLRHPLTQLSMNAIGQGFLADRMAALLRQSGVSSALLHLGETYAIGSHPRGRPWRLAVMGTGEAADLVGEMELVDAGLAVSASEPSRMLIDPVAVKIQSVDRVAAVVSAEGAAVADAFATAFAVAPASRWPAMAARLGGQGQVNVWESNRQVFAA